MGWVMTGFKPGASGVGNIQSINCDPTTVLTACITCLYYSLVLKKKCLTFCLVIVL